MSHQQPIGNKLLKETGYKLSNRRHTRYQKQALLGKGYSLNKVKSIYHKYKMGMTF